MNNPVPPECLAGALDELAGDYPHLRIQLQETVLSGGGEKLLAGEVDMLIAGSVPPGFLGEPILHLEFLAVSHPDHPLQHLGRALNLQDLTQHRQIVVRDSALKTQTDSGWLGAEQRWTVSHLGTSRDMIARGMGFAWLPLSRIRVNLGAGTLKALPLEHGARRSSVLYLIFADPDRLGPATRQLAESLRQQASTVMSD